jgi:hypothetical protein
MANKLQKTITEMAPNAKWDATKLVLGQIYEYRGWIMSIAYFLLTLGWQWWFSIPVTLQALVVLGLIWTALAVAFGTTRHFLRKRKAKELGSNLESEPNELSILPPSDPDDTEKALTIATREIENLKETLDNVKASKEILRDELEDDKKKLHAELSGLNRLVVLEKEHLEKIDFRFWMVRAFYCFEELDKSIPSLNFGFDVCNDSIFEIIVEKVEGYIEFEGDKLTGEMFCITKPSKIAPLVRHSSFTVKQRITPTEKPALVAARPLRGANFRISNLEITFRGGENADQIQSRKLKLSSDYAEDFELRTIVELREQIATLRNEHQAEVESHTLNAQNAIERLKADHQTALKERDAELDKVDFLIEPLKHQREYIGSYIVIERVFFLGIDMHSVPTLKFALRIRNYSCFDLEVINHLEENLYMDVPENGGELGWGTRNIHKFQGIKFLSNGDETGISAIGGVAEIGFSQRVDQSELEYLEQWKLNRPDLKNNYENYFIVNKLKFKIKGADPKWKVEEKVFTIPKEKIPIHKDRYIEMYDKAGIERL